MQVAELWPELPSVHYNELLLHQVYKNVSYRCAFVGTHSVYEGDVINNLVAYTVSVDGKFVDSLDEIKEIRDHLAYAATSTWAAYEPMSKEDLIQKNLEWYGFLFKGFFELAGMDWRPTSEMFRALKGKAIPDRLIMDSFPSYEELVTSPDYEVYWLKELYS